MAFKSHLLPWSLPILGRSPQPWHVQGRGPTDRRPHNLLFAFPAVIFAAARIAEHQAYLPGPHE